MTKSISLRKVIFITAALLFTVTATAQISEGGTPPSFGYESGATLLKSSKEIITYNINSPFTISQLLEDEDQNDTILPERVGILLAAGLSITENGEWDTLSDGEKICRLRITSQGALAISLYYDKFYIPEGGRLFIYNSDKTHILGAYTSRTNPSGGIFSSQFIAGDEVILEYSPAPGKTPELPQIYISDICYGYKGLTLKSSGSTQCMIDINCPEGDNWQEEKEGVVKMVTNIGRYSYLCTASLINNTSQDFTPYMYTAFHCIKDGTRRATDDELKQSQFYFNYELETCGGYTKRDYTSLIGCQFLTGKELNNGLDQVLLLMTSAIPSNLNPYFNGWDTGLDAAKSGVCIHHPKGVEKKISTFTSTAESGTWPDPLAEENAHWIVRFVKTESGHSATEQGSSGSPLFNQDHLIVGSLTGGNSSCENPSGTNYYGKILRFRDMISTYIDPIGKGYTKLAGCRMKENKPTPKNLTASWDKDITSVTLKWNTPDDTPISYNIYRNETKVGESTTETFTEEGLYVGAHKYYVTALYAEGNESAGSNTATVKKYNSAPPKNIDISRIGEQDINITWDKPTPKQDIFWGSGEASRKGGITGSEFPVYFGQQWYPEDIKDVNGYTITSITLYQHSNVDYAVYLAQGERSYTESIARSEKEGECTITLSEPFIVNSSEILICALKVLASDNQYYITIDNGTTVKNKGDIYSSDGKTWKNSGANNFYLKFSLSPSQTNTSQEIAQQSAGYNSSEKTSSTTLPDIVSLQTVPLETSSIVKSATSEAVTASSCPVEFIQPQYNIYCNGEKINPAALSSQTLSYKDYGKEKGKNYTYKVSAVFDGGVTESIEKDFYLKSESFDADIQLLTVNGNTIYKDVEETYNFIIDCGVETANINIIAQSGASVNIDGENSRSVTRNVSVGGIYSIPLQITSESGENTKNYTLSMYKLPENIILKRWDDILTVINNPENNGGFSFSSYKWFKNGVQLTETSQYIQLPSISENKDLYSVELVTADGITLRSCEQLFYKEQSTVKMYPTYIKPGEEITIYISSEYDNTIQATATITDMSGKASSVNINGEYTKIRLPESAGTYIVKVVTTNGSSKDFKIRVLN